MAVQDTYNRAVIRARLLFRGVPKDEEEFEALTPMEREVAEDLIEEQGEGAFVGLREQQHLLYDAALAGFLVELWRSFPDRPLQPGDVEEIMRPVSRSIAQLSLQAENLTEEGANEGIRRALEAHRRATQEASAQAGVTIDEDALRGLFEQVKARREGRRPEVEVRAVELQRRIHRQAQESLGSFIRHNAGRPGREAAREILQEMTRHPRIEQAVENLGPRGEAVRRAIQRAGRAETDLQEPGRSMYQNARRALVHEQNVAFHEADLLAAEASPAVKAVKWHTSMRHATLEGSPDACDIVEHANVYGLGSGLYPPGAAPSLLHPYCEDWWEHAVGFSADAEPSKPAMISIGEGRRILTENRRPGGRTLTGQYVASQTALANRKIQVAYDAFVDF